MYMIDNGQPDEKIIAVCVNDPFYKDYNSIKDLPAHVSEQIKHFFMVYKSLEGKETSVDNVLAESDEAKIVIEKCIERYVDKFEWK